MRKSFSTTNVVEAINGQLEIMRRNSGGYFHSEDTLKFKLGLAVSSLENGKWRIANHRIHSVLPQLNALFQAQFEGTSRGAFNTTLLTSAGVVRGVSRNANAGSLRHSHRRQTMDEQAEPAAHGHDTAGCCDWIGPPLLARRR